MEIEIKLDRNGYGPTILQSKKECWVSHQTGVDLVRHEVFGGYANRALSKRYGLWVWLTPQWHNMSKNGVHFNKPLDLKLKRFAQAEFEVNYPDLDFIELFGKNYL